MQRLFKSSVREDDKLRNLCCLVRLVVVLRLGKSKWNGPSRKVLRRETLVMERTGLLSQF
ncbi:hypothetical protein Hanom_Chr08g00747551 [Helianthus anomalus]